MQHVVELANDLPCPNFRQPVIIVMLAGLLEHLPVLAYGERMSLQSLGSVSVQDAQTLIVTPFDPQAGRPRPAIWSLTVLFAVYMLDMHRNCACETW